MYITYTRRFTGVLCKLEHWFWETVSRALNKLQRAPKAKKGGPEPDLEFRIMETSDK